MSWTPPSTKGAGLNEPHKVLLYGHHGWGKTWQVRNFAKQYGKGFLLSGESGLKSLADVDIEYAPFTSWDGPHDPDNGVFSFRGLCRWVASKEFKDAGYKWIAVDSLTELSDLLYAWAEEQTKGEKNRFAVWELYGKTMLSTLKWIRDLKLHVYVTSLAAEATDDNTAATDYWPMVKGAKVARNIPAIFDHVFCAIRRTTDEEGDTKVLRFIVTEEVKGWHGKVRDPFNRVQPVEETNDLTELLERMTRSPEEEEKRRKALATAKETAAAIAALNEAKADGKLEKEPEPENA